MNSKTSKHHIPLTPLRLNHSKLNQQIFQVLYVGVTVSSLLSILQSAMSVLVIRMIFTHQGQTTMKSTTCLTLKWRFLARIASPSSSATIHFFGLRISPSWSEIFNRRRISFRSSRSVKFLGRLGKIEGFFISNPCIRCCLYFKQFSVSLLILLVKYSIQNRLSLCAKLGRSGDCDLGLAKNGVAPSDFNQIDCRSDTHTVSARCDQF